eukprot:2099097-Pyramimonas_sp.AAC.1
MHLQNAQRWLAQAGLRSEFGAAEATGEEALQSFGGGAVASSAPIWWASRSRSVRDCRSVRATLQWPAQASVSRPALLRERVPDHEGRAG